MSAVFLADETTQTAARLRLAMDIPMDVVTDNDFDLESMLRVEAAISAELYLGRLALSCTFHSFDAYEVAGDDGRMLHLVTVWDLVRP
ncbi:hypothetical protein K2Z83_13505 [Oscillochloris sp. ZM17-4]|uniref:hypothetical protein n=1 Tax=Oscillochloris sp. ZM17-4 TaxID=2866714 RepID=UPI001C72F05E|nr:hypothetical protein [Oscillochloris sp. ZM17-4]MBX0328693.1 hypothetical protein [Oscillochloris sp. ZM17-4]